jgi:hydrogenase maturation protease
MDHTPPSPSSPGPILVIGYGNSLRGDDAVGPRAAAAVASWSIPGVKALALAQLTPELAEPLAAARTALFVDARLASVEVEVEESIAVQPIEPAERELVLTHGGDPRHLLALARMAFGTSPRSWLVTIPAADFRLGAGLSPLAEQGLLQALGWIATKIGLAPGLDPQFRRSFLLRDFC